MEHLHQYVILDGARMQHYLDEAIALNPVHRSLFILDEEDPLASVSPYLFSYHPGQPFAQWLEREGHGQGWGSIFSSYKSFEFIYKHFRQLLIIKNESGEKFYFRFYDPKVIRTTLPAFDKQQLLQFFGAIQSIVCEDFNEDYQIKFTMRNHELHRERKHSSKSMHRSQELQKKITKKDTKSPTIIQKNNPWI
jgi:hypothetical protein